MDRRKIVLFQKWNWPTLFWKPLMSFQLSTLLFNALSLSLSLSLLSISSIDKTEKLTDSCNFSPWQSAGNCPWGQTQSIAQTQVACLVTCRHRVSPCQQPDSPQTPSRGFQQQTWWQLVQAAEWRHRTNKKAKQIWTNRVLWHKHSAEFQSHPCS